MLAGSLTVEKAWLSRTTQRVVFALQLSVCKAYAKRAYLHCTRKPWRCHSSLAGLYELLLIQGSCLFCIDSFPLDESRINVLCSTDSFVLLCPSHLIETARDRCDVIQLCPAERCFGGGGSGCFCCVELRRNKEPKIRRPLV